MPVIAEVSQITGLLEILLQWRCDYLVMTLIVSLHCVCHLQHQKCNFTKIWFRHFFHSASIAHSMVLNNYSRATLLELGFQRLLKSLFSQSRVYFTLKPSMNNLSSKTQSILPLIMNFFHFNDVKCSYLYMMILNFPLWIVRWLSEVLPWPLFSVYDYIG